MSFYIGDIAHWDTPSRVRGLFTPGEPEGLNFKTKLYQPLQITDVHEGEAGAYYSGWMVQKGRMVFLEGVLETQLIGKKSWENTLPLLDLHPELYQAPESLKVICPVPRPGYVYVLLRSIYTDGDDDHTTLAVSPDARLLRAWLTADLLSQTEQEQIGRNRVCDLAVGISEEGRYYLSWSGEWENHQNAHYTITDEPLLTEEADIHTVND